ncbi:MAG TPA: ATP-binding protein [Kofleriaceae bacterium]
MRFEFRTRDEAAGVVADLAQTLVLPSTLEFVLMELMVNAVEHGNLEIGAFQKQALVKSGALEAELAVRLTKLPYSVRIATLTVDERDGRRYFTVGDEGPGFDWRTIGMPNPSASCGRGLALVHAMIDSGLRFNDSGNRVTLSVSCKR